MKESTRKIAKEYVSNLNMIANPIAGKVSLEEQTIYMRKMQDLAKKSVKKIIEESSYVFYSNCSPCPISSTASITDVSFPTKINRYFCATDRTGFVIFRPSFYIFFACFFVFSPTDRCVFSWTGDAF